MEYIKLNNGIKVLFHQMLNTHSVTIGLYIKAGSAYEMEEQNGITHFLEHLHFRQLGRMSQEELYYKMECIGSDLRGLTYCDFLEYNMKIHPDNLEEALAIFREIIYADEWDDMEFEKERQVVINQIKEKGNYISLENEVRKCVFQNSPLANEIMGTAENVRNFKKSDLKNYKKQIFTNNNLIFCITGCLQDAGWEKARKILESVDLRDGNPARSPVVPQVFHSRKPDMVFLMTNDRLLDVNLSFDISGRKQTGELLSILNCILGEGTGSNLQKKLRENLGYTSDIYSYLERYKGFAVMHIRFSVEKRLLKQCLTEIIYVISDTKNKITSRDLDVSLPFYTKNKIFLEDDTAEMNFQLAYQNFVLSREIENEELKNNRQTIISLQKLAQTVFIPENAGVVIIGNVNGISKKSVREIIRKLSG